MSPQLEKDNAELRAALAADAIPRAVRNLQVQLRDAAPAASAVRVPEADLSVFSDWLSRNMPAGTVIGDPAWWAPRILAAAAPSHPAAVQQASVDTYTISAKTMEAVFSALAFYELTSSYDAPRIGGTLAGSPRGKVPDAKRLVEWARHAMRELKKELPAYAAAPAAPVPAKEWLVTYGQCESQEFATDLQAEHFAAGIIAAGWENVAVTRNWLEINNQSAPPSDGVTASADDDPAEIAYWRFDARHKGYADWKQCPQSERDAFKAEWRMAYASGNEQPDVPANQDARDAARYRWLRNQDCLKEIGKMTPYAVQGQTMKHLDGKELDAAVDAAMQSSATPRKEGE